MRPLLVNCSYAGGGAAKAAQRLASALTASGVAARVWQAPEPRLPAAHELRRIAAAALLRLQRSRNGTDRSINAFPSGLVRAINASPCDVVHLHWIGAEAVRIEQLAEIRKPVVWTLHDEWAFCGTEHYAAPGDERFRTGYGHLARPAGDGGVDLDAWTWRRKRSAWRALAWFIACPSRWLAERARASALFSDRPVRCIANTLPLDAYSPGDRREARRRLGLPQDAALLGFGAAAALSDPRKGFALLQRALEELARQAAEKPLRLVLFGRDAPLPPLRLPVHDLGIIGDERRLADVLRAIDVFVCPSAQENLPNTVLEALACGTPCAAFAVGGLADLIEHGRNGHLAAPGRPDALANAIRACFEPRTHAALSAAARSKIEAEFAPPIIARRYAALYEEAMSCNAAR